MIELEEFERLGVLAALELLDTPPDYHLDGITRLASDLLGTRSAAVSLIDDERQWFKSRVGIPFNETPRDQAFCSHAVASKEFFEVGDASHDPRFIDNPLVTCEDGIRFYAGAPLIVSSGHCLGTLCVFDPEARPPLSPGQRRGLTGLAGLAVERIEGVREKRLSEIALRLVNAVSEAILCVDARGRISYWNRAAEVMFGYPAAVALGHQIDLVLPAAEQMARRYRSIVRSLSRGKARPGQVFELTARRASSEHFSIELSVAHWQNEVEGGRPTYAAIIRDVTERNRKEQENAQTRRFLDIVIANLPAMLFVKDSKTRRYQLLNRAGEDIIGLSASEVIDHTDRELFPDVGDHYHERDSQALADGGVQSHESAFTRKDGRRVHLRTKRIVVDGPDRQAQFLLGMSEDVTDTRDAQARILQLAHHDSLTGLANRASFLTRLENLVKVGDPFAVLTIDLDRFKAINDQFGHRAGDEVLVEVADRLRSITEGDGFVSRLGGDEFTVLLASDDVAEQARVLAEILILELSKPYHLERFVAHTGASIGVVIGPDDGASAHDLRQAADLAMYRAKAGGGRAVCFFSPEMDRAARDRRALERDLRQAVERKLIHVAYQRVVSTVTGDTTSFEALARWTHPDRGPIPPDLFISIAEECGLISELGEQVLEIACREAASWPGKIRVAVNLSPIQFETGNLVGLVRDVLDRTGLPSSRLQLEVTEGLVIRNVDQVFSKLEELRELGIQVLMDDFGVGYSSLSYFERFSFDKVKIDRSFVRKMLASPAATAVIESVIGLGNRLGMGIVAEGVETEEQKDALVRMGCTHLQGYLISRPLTSLELGQTIQTGGDLH